MNSKAIEMLAQLSVALHARAAARGEKGQGTLEYVGIAIVAAILVVAVVDAVTGANIGSVISTQIQKIVSKGA